MLVRPSVQTISCSPECSASLACIDDKYNSALKQLTNWIESRDYAGYEPYDLLNSPYLTARALRHRFVAPIIIQAGRRWGGLRLRKWLRVLPSKNPKALGLCLSAYSDLSEQGSNYKDQSFALKAELQGLRSPGECCMCWGYDWDFASLRGTVLAKLSPNCIVTCFVASALLDMGLAFGDADAVAMAQSAGEFIYTRLNRSVNSPEAVCLSYTPGDRTRIYNNSVVAGAFLARLAVLMGQPAYLDLAKRSMRYLAEEQKTDGSWTYGAAPNQRWIDGFHSGYNLCALLQYRGLTGDASFDKHLDRGYEFYKTSLVQKNGAPKYFHNGAFPIDIHACSQAILTFCAFRERDPEALRLAVRTADWTLNNMRSDEGTFFYQRHRSWTNRTPYMRWGQAWMFRSLARLISALRDDKGNTAGTVVGCPESSVRVS